VPYCIHCGTRVPDDAQFCTTCGRAQRATLTEEINNSQGEDIQSGMRYAGFWRRVGSSVIDGLIITVPLNILLAAVVHNSAVHEIAILAAALAYGPWLISLRGSTIGMRALKMRASHVDGSMISYPQALRRGLLRQGFAAVTFINLLVPKPKIVQGIALTPSQAHQFHIVLAVGLITCIPMIVDLWWMRRGSKRQTLHDAWTNSVFVRL
jgi:uncharacterized RDD family membrane protein YckC